MGSQGDSKKEELESGDWLNLPMRDFSGQTNETAGRESIESDGLRSAGKGMRICQQAPEIMRTS